MADKYNLSREHRDCVRLYEAALHILSLTCVLDDGAVQAVVDKLHKEYEFAPEYEKRAALSIIAAIEYARV